MGRKIIKSDNGYAIHEDASEEEKRISKYFTSKEDMKEKFLKVEFPERCIDIFLKTEWCPTMGPFGGSREIDMVLELCEMKL